MPWYLYLAHFFGGVFFTNALPHLGAGIIGLPMQTPFATPPFRGLSSPRVNVGWGLANLVVAYLLLVRVGPLELQNSRDIGAAFVGFALWALMCARSFTRLRQTD